MYCQYFSYSRYDLCCEYFVSFYMFLYFLFCIDNQKMNILVLIHVIFLCHFFLGI